MYKLMLFDLGNVVIDISFERIFDYWAALYGQDAAILRERFRFGEPHFAYESGKLSVAAFAELVAEKLQLPLTQAEFEAGWGDIFLGMNPTIVPILEELRHGYIVAALSNTDPIHRREFWRLYGFEMGLFDRIFSSDEIGVRKPSVGAYEFVLDYYGVSANETVFLDDKAENIEAARAMGMSGILVRGFSDIRVGLESLGVLGV